jgi:hypothetical protein
MASGSTDLSAGRPERPHAGGGRQFEAAGLRDDLEFRELDLDRLEPKT